MHRDSVGPWEMSIFPSRTSVSFSQSLELRYFLSMFLLLFPWRRQHSDRSWTKRRDRREDRVRASEKLDARSCDKFWLVFFEYIWQWILQNRFMLFALSAQLFAKFLNSVRSDSRKNTEYRYVCTATDYARHHAGSKGSKRSIRRFFFLFEFTSPRTYDPGFRCFVKQSSKQEEKKKSSKLVFLLQKWA